MPRDRLLRFGLRSSRLKRRLRNPYFSKIARVRGHRGGHTKKIILISAIIIGLGLILAIPLAAVTHPFLTVRQVQFNLSNTIPPPRQSAIRAAVEEQLSAAVMLGLTRRSYFLLDTNRVHQAVAATGVYASIVVKKNFPDRLTITVTEPDRIFLITDGELQAVADGRGVVIEAGTKASGTQLMLGVATSSLIMATVERTSSSLPSLSRGANGIPLHCATLITGLHDKLRGLGISIREYVVNDRGTLVRALTNEGWSIMLDPAVSARDQLERITAIIHDPRYQSRSRIDYVDVRYAERVYIKLK